MLSPNTSTTPAAIPLPGNIRQKKSTMRMNMEGSAPIVQAIGVGKQVAAGDDVITILSDVSFAALSGEALAILGVSGSGKSTLLGLLAGLDLPTAGRVMLDGADLSALDEDGRAA